MKRILILLCAALLLLSACGAADTSQSMPEAAPALPQPEAKTAPPPPEATAEPYGPVALKSLTVELVIGWDDADQILGELDTLSQLLESSLLLQGYEAEDITITVNTAGGFTGDALSSGGVDIALLPAADYVSCEEDTAAVLTTIDEPCTGVVAVSCLREELDEAFRSALASALLDTEPGQEFMSLYSPELLYEPAAQDALQLVREWVAENPEHTGG